MARWLIVLVAFLALAPQSFAQEKIDDAKPVVVPYRLTRTQHVLVRVKIDGKGPFHFIVDTGCPVLVISTEAAKKAGLKEEKGWGVIDKLEIEGGLVQDKVKARIETPFQIEGMNAMGLPGIELHGLMGYTVIAKYKMQFDFTKDTMLWTPLAFSPPPLEMTRSKDIKTDSLDMLGGVMKVLSKMAGLKPAVPGVPRGFVGLELAAKSLKVEVVLADSPAATSGILTGDVLEKINDRSVTTPEELQTSLGQLRVGQDLILGIERNGTKKTVKIKAGAGI